MENNKVVYFTKCDKEKKNRIVNILGLKIKGMFGYNTVYMNDYMMIEFSKRWTAVMYFEHTDNEYITNSNRTIQKVVEKLEG